MKLPDRFYYTIRDFFNEMEPLEPIDDRFVSIGIMIGSVFKGIRMTVDDEILALELTGMFLEGATFTTEEDNEDDEL